MRAAASTACEKQSGATLALGHIVSAGVDHAGEDLLVLGLIPRLRRLRWPDLGRSLAPAAGPRRLRSPGPGRLQTPAAGPRPRPISEKDGNDERTDTADAEVALSCGAESPAGGAINCGPEAAGWCAADRCHRQDCDLHTTWRSDPQHQSVFDSRLLPAFLTALRLLSTIT